VAADEVQLAPPGQEAGPDDAVAEPFQEAGGGGFPGAA